MDAYLYALGQALLWGGTIGSVLAAVAAGACWMDGAERRIFGESDHGRWPLVILAAAVILAFGIAPVGYALSETHQAPQTVEVSR